MPFLVPEFTSRNPNILLPGCGAFLKIFARLSRCHTPGFTPRAAPQLSFRASILQRDMARRKVFRLSPTRQFLACCSSFLLPPQGKSPDSI